MIGDTDFFILESSMATKFYWAQVEIQASLKESIVRGELLPEKPITMEVSSGTQAADFIWNSHVLLVASKRTIDLLNREGFTGWGTYPVRIKTPSGFLEGYRGISVHGRGGDIDEEKSKVRWSKADGCGNRSIFGMRGQYFDLSKWDGCDFFIVGGGITVTVTKEVVKAFKKEKISGCRYTCIKDYSFGAVE